RVGLQVTNRKMIVGGGNESHSVGELESGLRTAELEDRRGSVRAVSSAPLKDRDRATPLRHGHQLAIAGRREGDIMRIVDVGLFTADVRERRGLESSVGLAPEQKNGIRIRGRYCDHVARWRIGDALGTLLALRKRQTLNRFGTRI